MTKMSVPVHEGVQSAPRRRRQWLVVSYDIPDDKRRMQVMKILSGYGQRVQYSVFECEMRPQDVEEMTRRLRQAIQRTQDDIRIYRLCESCVGKVEMLGKAERFAIVSTIFVGE